MIADFICGLTKLISGVSVRWLGVQPEDKPRVYFANHTSHLDFIVLWAALPKDIRLKTRPVAARDYWAKGRLRNYLARKVFNAVLIDRKHLCAHDEEHNPIHLMTEVLDQGYSLIIFPEGTRNLEDNIGPFKSGLYHLHKQRPASELVPVYLENFNRILPKGEFIIIPILGSVTFGKPLAQVKAETKVDFLNRARQALEELKNR